MTVTLNLLMSETEAEKIIKQTIILDKFDFNNIDFTKTKFNNFNIVLLYQKINEYSVKAPIFIQMKPIRVTKYMVPVLGENNFQTTEQSINFFRIVLNPSNPICQELEHFLIRADEFFVSDGFKKKIFKQKLNQYIYNPVVKKIYHNDKNLDNDPQNIKFKYIKPKCKFPQYIHKNGKPIRVKSMTEMLEHIKDKRIQFKIELNKIWAANANYCLTLRVVDIEVIENRPIVHYMSLNNKEQLRNVYRKHVENMKESKQKKILIEI